jgi:hypothetical protein
MHFTHHTKVNDDMEFIIIRKLKNPNNLQLNIPYN